MLGPETLRRAVRFGLSGLFVTGFHSAIAAGLIEFLGAIPSVANGIAFVLATLASYLINTYWSFSGKPAPKSMLRFVCVALFGLSLTVGIAGLVDSYGLSYWIGIGCCILIVPPTTFLLHHFWTYR
jgi:putative flippase GtrA